MKDVIHWNRIYYRCNRYLILINAVMIVSAFVMILTSGTIWLIALMIWIAAAIAYVIVWRVQKHALNMKARCAAEIFRRIRGEER